VLSRWPQRLALAAFISRSTCDQLEMRFDHVLQALLWRHCAIHGYFSNSFQAIIDQVSGSKATL
jgi:hypothetical protein